MAGRQRPHLADPARARRPGIARANRDIFAYARDGEAGRVRLTTSLDNEEQSSWSPDGRRIAFKRRDAVWVVDADGSGLSR